MLNHGPNTESSSACSPNPKCDPEQFSFKNVSPLLCLRSPLSAFASAVAKNNPPDSAAEKNSHTANMVEPTVTPFCTTTVKESRWNAADDYHTDDESIPSVIGDFGRNHLEISPIRFFDLTSTELIEYSSYPRVAVKSQINSNPCEERKHKKAERDRKNDLISKAQSLLSEIVSKGGENDVICPECGKGFATGQALGGHMSKKHPGQSEAFTIKQKVRNDRILERAKLHLAKKRFCSENNVDYDELIKTPSGKMQIKKMIDRAKVRYFKKKISDIEAETFIKDTVKAHHIVKSLPLDL